MYCFISPLLPASVDRCDLPLRNLRSEPHIANGSKVHPQPLNQPRHTRTSRNMQSSGLKPRVATDGTMLRARSAVLARGVRPAGLRSTVTTAAARGNLLQSHNLTPHQPMYQSLIFRTGRRVSAHAAGKPLSSTTVGGLSLVVKTTA